MKCKMIAYVRVSTDEQGHSGLGIEAQVAAIAQHVQANGCDLLATYREIETGKRDSLDNRPQLRAAIAHAKRSKATLVVGKLDRLTRSVAVLSLLHTSGVEFVCCDNPHANRLTVQLLSVVAEDEVRRISERTKDALKVYKDRGGKLGASLPQCRNNLSLEARRKGAKRAGEAHRRNAAAAYSDLVPMVRDLRDRGESLKSIARNLNAQGHTTRTGKSWNPTQVSRILARA